MNELIFSINTVFPIFVVIIFGYVITRFKFLNPQIIKGLNNLVFYFAIPAFLFSEIAKSNLKKDFDGKFILFAFCSTIFTFFFSWLIGEIFIKDKEKIGTFVQGCYRSNYALLALPLIVLILGPSAGPKSALITAFIIPFNNIAAVFILSTRSKKLESQNKVKISKILLDVIKNPFIIGILSGLPFCLLNTFANFNILDPNNSKLIATSVDYIAKIGTPLALISIGGSIDFSKIKNSFWVSSFAAAMKVIILPLIVISVAFLFNFEGADMLILLIAFGTPTAVSSFILAGKMGGDDKMATNIVLISTFASVFTITLGVYIFKFMSLI